MLIVCADSALVVHQLLKGAYGCSVELRTHRDLSREVAGKALWNVSRKIREGAAPEEVDVGTFDDHRQRHLRKGVTNKSAAVDGV